MFFQFVLLYYPFFSWDLKNRPIIFLLFILKLYPFPSYSRKSNMQPLCQCLMLTDTFPSLRQREDLKALIPFTHTPNSYVLSTYSKSVYDPCVCACLLGGWGCHLFLQFLTHRDLSFGESGYFRTHFGQCILKFTFRNNLRPRMILPSSRENFCFGRYVEALKIWVHNIPITQDLNHWYFALLVSAILPHFQHFVNTFFKWFF